MQTKQKHFTLIGMSGAGKSTVGRALAKVSKRVFYDSDAEIKNKCGLIPAQIFERYGEERFRGLEKEVLLDLANRHEASVISTGGGAMMQSEIAENLFQKTLTIWLKVEEEVLWNRQKNNVSNRPMLLGDNPRKKLQDLLHEREIVFREADIVISENELTPAEIADEILKKIDTYNDT